MKRTLYFGFISAFLILLALVFPIKKSSQLQNNNSESGFNHVISDDYYRNLLADPKTGRVPKNIRDLELDFASTLPFLNDRKRDDIWKSRGPNNLGGRTRAFGVNIKNKLELLAGSATGGIFKSTDGGNSWRKTNCPVQAITCLIQDKRPGNELIWYAGTGELSGSSGSAGGAYFYGEGILKTIDGGENWTKLSSTVGNSPTSFDSDFDGVWNLALDESNLDQDELYAAVYSGIYKSVDGGITWKLKRSGSIGTYSYYTNVCVDSKGIVYAALSDESSHKGIWRSIDGESWTSITPTGFPSKYGRIAIGIAPSDENQVYFLAANTSNFGFKSTNFLGVDEWNSLWKYDYVNGNGAGANGRWINKSAFLPDKGGDFGYFSSQQGYDLMVNVHPKDTNMVFLGVTNLWRSSDGFKSNQNTDWIGGYAVNTYRPNYKMYHNHHPDQHSMFFSYDDPNKVYSTHDGGISFTENITDKNVNWLAKNEHYITSQFYSIALDKATNFSQLIIGGLQDNGTYFVNQYGLSAWHMSFSSDGSHCFVKNGGNEIYASTQLGRIAHLKVSAIGEAIEYARLDPAQLNRNDYDFINPFVIDPLDQKIMYLPAKTRIFRNLNIEAKPLSPIFDSTRWDTPLWVELVNCTVPNGSEISAITVSKSNPNTMFYATDRGKLYKVSQAHNGQAKPIDITGPNFSTGNINCIATDPIDSNFISIVFSNYNIISLFHSKDGGQTWVNISGNLEANVNGSGSGPSCRWAAVMPLQNGKRTWFVGTSVGLFATDSLNNINTVWIKQSPNGIGNNIVTMIDTRPSDFQLVVATHGNGVYSANIASAWQITNLNPVQNEKQFNVFPNPITTNQFQIQNFGTSNQIIKLNLRSLDGKIIHNGIQNFNALDKNLYNVYLNDIPSGIYILEIVNDGKSYFKKLLVETL